MDKIRFVKNGETYDAEVYVVSQNVVGLKLVTVVEKSVLVSGFDVINEHNGKVMASYKDYTTEYRKMSDLDEQLSNDGSIYVPPAPPAPIELEASATWDDGNNEDKIRPASVTVTLYNGGIKVSSKKLSETNAWKCVFEAPADGDFTFDFSKVDGYTIEGEQNIVYYHMPLSQVKETKINYINKSCSERIYAGSDITLSNGEVLHFSFTDHVQSNITTAYNTVSALVQMGEENVPIPFYDANDVCAEYLPVDIFNIYFGMGVLITESVTLAHQLQDEIEKMTDPAEVEKVTYDIACLDAEHKAEYDRLVQSALDIIDILKRRLKGDK